MNKMAIADCGLELQTAATIFLSSDFFSLFLSVDIQYQTISCDMNVFDWRLQQQTTLQTI